LAASVIPFKMGKRYLFREQQNDYPFTEPIERELADAIDHSGVRHLRLLEPIIAYEIGNRGPALFLPYDHHLSVDGSIFIGNAIADYLEKWRPWAH